jgi:hypothetical protein
VWKVMEGKTALKLRVPTPRAVFEGDKNFNLIAFIKKKHKID